MKKVIKKLAALALALCMSTAVLPFGVKAEDNAGALTMENFGLKWTGGSSKTVISDDGKTFIHTPAGNAGSSVKAEVSFSCGGDEGVDTGKAEIRLPLHVILDREGNPIDTIEMSIPQAPATGGPTIFNYWIDEENQEIVLTNYAPIPAGAFFMKAEVTWNFSAFEVESGADLNAVQANISLTGNDENNPLTAVTDKIGGSVNTSVQAFEPTKEVASKKESWQDEWGTKPADADDYFYVVWEMSQSYSTLQTTSPYTVYFEDIPGNGGGEPVAWKNTGGTYIDEEFKQPDPASDKSALEQMNADPVGEVKTHQESIDSSKTRFKRLVVMKYPRSMTENGATPFISNKVNAKTVTPEGAITEKVALGRYTYQVVSTGVNYGGDSFDMYKRAEKDWEEKNKRETKPMVGALNVLRNGTPVEASWSIDVKNMSWNRTDNGNETYDTVLRDGMMYVAGERLLPGDYELSKFYPAQYDVYGPAYTDDLGWFLAIYNDYTNEECYAPIHVYVEDEAGNWSEFGQVKKTGETTYSWTDRNGTTSEVSKTTPVDLPAGTQDIKYVHTDNAYGVEYRMSLFYKLKPSEHLLGLIGADTTSFNLININEAWGEQNGKIYTQGNEFNSESTPTIKEDVEKSDAEEFAGRFEDNTDHVAHDYSEHSFTAVTVKSDFKKSLGEVKNEQNKERVSIPVDLSYDAYVSYKSLGITLEEAVEANLVDQCNEMVFYDLLPAGATVDPTRVFAKSYFGTNLDDRNEAFERTVEMVDNWRGSGRTMMIIRVNTPDGYRNFAKSSTYLETGMKVSFTMYNSYANMSVNGTKIQNDAAAFSMDGPIPDGVSDTGVGSKEPDFFNNLGESAGNSDLEQNVRYSTAIKDVVVPMASQMGFTKKVKGAGDTSYGTSAKVPATGDYSYEMRFAIPEKQAAKRIVLYDVLETAYDDKPYWAGTFKSVETASIKKQFPDTDPVVYYSTSKAFGKLNAQDGIDYTDLTNTDLWTTELPEDVSTVTAVAVDLRKDINGNDKVFEGEMALAAHIYMEAPANYLDYIDNPATAEKDPVYAYNQAFIKKGDDEPEGSEITTVEIVKPDMKIVKSSDPAGGTTAKKATEVIVGDEIVYTLDVSNKNPGDATENIKVTDVIPDHLTIDTDRLTYYFGKQAGSEQPADGTGRVKASVDGQTVTFEIDKLAILEVVHLRIPVTVSEDAEAGEVFTNIAKISEFNDEEWGDEYKSNETNHKTVSVTTAFPVSKSLTGSARPQEKEFTFTLTGVDAAPMPETTSVTITGEGNDVFAKITYMIPGEYHYTIAENAKPDTGYDGYTFDATTHEIVVTVEEVEEKLVASWTDNGAEGTTVAFTNNYAPLAAEVSFPVTKVISGNARPEEKDFTFVLAGEDDAPMPQESEVTITGEGTSAFGTITYTETGVYHYSVSETAGSDYGYTYSKAILYVDVTVTDENGTLQAAYTVSTKEDGQDAEEADSIVFTNDYRPDEVSLNLPVIKKLEGNVRPEEKEFEFVLETDTNAPLPDEGNEVTITGEGSAEFGTITYTEAGTYTYTISETDTGEKGYTYDDTKYTVTVSVKDIEGVLTAGWKIEGKEEDSPAAVFTNTYAPAEVEILLPVEKKIEGEERPFEKDFTFVLKGEGNAPMPEVDDVTIRGEGSAQFGAITYTEAGTYNYTVSERNTGETGYTYDTSVFRITVTVTDEDGELKAVYAYEEESPVFVNHYAPQKTSVILPAEKQIKGDARSEEEVFTFCLKGEELEETVEITGEGFASFPELFFEQAGTYTYEICEKPGTAKNYTYSTDVYKVTIEVTDADGKLESTVTYTKNGKKADTAVFVNTYEKPVAVVETGYESSAMIWMTLCMTALAGMFVILKKRRNA